MKNDSRLYKDILRDGFTLIELLVTIAIIAVIVGFVLPNFLGARERARDASKKAGLVQLKNALRLYYNDYKRYPCSQADPGCDTKNTSNLYFFGCGNSVLPAVPSTQCTASLDANSVMYMKTIPDYNGSGPGYGFNYCLVAGGDDFRFKISLENNSDQDAATSQTRCPITCNMGVSYQPNEYVVCAD